jgi:epoxyqueuosine reductase
MNNQMNHDLSKLMNKNKIDIWGVADLSKCRQQIERFITSPLPAQTAIVFGRAVVNEYIDQLPDKGHEYFINFNHVLLHELDLIAADVVEWLKKLNYNGIPIIAGSCTATPSNQSFEFIRGITKISARLAGLAWIGKSSYLVTNQFGPRVGWSCVLTSAPLHATYNPLPSKCGGCRKCIEHCPVGAIANSAYFDEKTNPTCGFDADKCFKHYRGKLLWPKQKECCICMMVCPYGKQFAKKCRVNNGIDLGNQCSDINKIVASKDQNTAQQGDAPEPATNAIPASQQSISPAR